ncbi:hypothetical protein A2686_00280 [Candidatus Woesebacteria bacterium RIFCSPHIGHO2_01_FULL_38_10]|uniref:Putative pre-16S rRNA nuclease n=1 Tax=Candidatus Woesebacteria bacterium RIFCSPLOWO2_01_FULL_39_10b TaxID=1802517 RepID=A0A1F8B6B5_9BACT|nr:MAG: hypothetical protein A2686_00280 [Candidatus Woesebacteria bacterium RIFCSPHIGHO2_01_FULL_38_10]OGM58908.1 MAG: hypothetical protein A2892_04915 [Candidatus Woesebacteria bacterium RIFCSPLOWO2_01_FULL_39_10b]
MRILGVDYGRKKIGLALASTRIAEPFKVIRYRDYEEAIEKLRQVVQVEKVEKFVLGISEGKMAEETRKFARRIEEKLKIPIVFQDETLTTRRSQELSIEAGIKRKKRKALEDAYSATLILQSFLDSIM